MTHSGTFIRSIKSCQCSRCDQGLEAPLEKMSVHFAVAVESHRVGRLKPAHAFGEIAARSRQAEGVPSLATRPGMK
jgi:hypothetical protein